MQRLAILITVYNGMDKVLACLAECYRQADLLAADGRYGVDIWLNDDGSTEGISEGVLHRFPKVHLIHSDGTLYWSKGLRKVWLEAAGDGYDFYLWLYYKMTLRDQALYTLLDTSSFLGRSAIVVGSVESEDGVLCQGGRSRSSRLIEPDPVIPKPCYIFDGRLVLVPKYVFDRLGAMDGRYRHKLGDFDYAIRAYKAGINRVVAPGIFGVCAREPAVLPWRDPRKSLRDRYRVLLSPIGKPLKEHFLFELRSKGFLSAVWTVVKLNLQVLFPVRNS